MIDESFQTKALWATFILYLVVSFVNTAGLASHFEPNWFVCNLWALAVELGDVTLLLGTIRRKREHKPYGGYLLTFLVSLAVSVCANVAEWSNNFLGDNSIYTALHAFEHPLLVPALLGITIPALMLATGSLLSDLSPKKAPNQVPGEEGVNAYPESKSHETREPNINITKIVMGPETSISTKEKANYQDGESIEIIESGELKSNKFPTPQEINALSVDELSEKYNRSKKTAQRWKKKNLLPS